RISSDEPIPPARLRAAYVVAVAIWLPVPFLAVGFVIPAIAWLAFVGLAVPAVAHEGRGFREAFGRGARLARADYPHALFSLATLALTAFLCQGVLFFLLRGQGEATLDAAAFLANLVVSPV